MTFKIEPTEVCVISLDSAPPPFSAVKFEGRLPPASVSPRMFDADEDFLLQVEPDSRFRSILNRDLHNTPAEKRSRRMEIAGLVLVSVGAPMMLGGFFPLMSGVGEIDFASSRWLSRPIQEDHLNKGRLQVNIGAPLFAIGGAAWISGVVILLSRPKK